MRRTCPRQAPSPLGSTSTSLYLDVPSYEEVPQAFRSRAYPKPHPRGTPRDALALCPAPPASRRQRDS